MRKHPEAGTNKQCPNPYVRTAEQKLICKCNIVIVLQHAKDFSRRYKNAAMTEGGNGKINIITRVVVYLFLR